MYLLIACGEDPVRSFNAEMAAVIMDLKEG